MEVQDLGVELAAGGLLWRDVEAREEIALIHRTRYDDWSLPKGKLDLTQDDNWVDAAVREVKEETGCEFDLREFVDCISYVVDGTPKVVLFWNMELIKEGQFKSGEETNAIKWVSVPDALRKLDYSEQQAVIARATSQFPPVTCGDRTFKKHWWRNLRSMGFWPRGSSHKRLSSALASYEIELFYLIMRVGQEQRQRESQTLPWAEAACSLLNDV